MVDLFHTLGNTWKMMELLKIPASHTLLEMEMLHTAHHHVLMETHSKNTTANQEQLSKQLTQIKLNLNYKMDQWKPDLMYTLTS